MLHRHDRPYSSFEMTRPARWARRRLARLAPRFRAARFSLTGRLVASFMVAITLALLVAGLVIQALYDRAAERTFDARLNVYLAVLAGNAAGEAGELAAVGNLGEPQFELPLSGWYWQIRRLSDGELVQVSPSLFDGVLALPDTTEADEAGIRRGYTSGPGGERLRMLERVIRLLDGSAYTFAVAGVDSELLAEKASFATNLRVALATFAVFLMVVLGLQVWYGLKPLSEVRRALWRVRLGQADRLDGRFATELQPLVDDLNALIRSNAEIVERARTHVGNLAHALKTPLSVVLNEARGVSDGPAEKIIEQAELMRERIKHALDRARIAASASVIGAVTGAGEAIAPIIRTMERIHAEKALRISTAIAPGVRFRGERQDFEEIVGNLVDNACKWARSQVEVALAEEQTSGDQHVLILIVEDDGPGLDAAEQAEALKRGRRLDETKPGSGLGLSIVADLATLYGGSLSLDRSSTGGLKAVVKLPSI